LGDSVPTVTPASGSTTFANASLSPMFAQVQAEATRYVSEGLYLCPAGTTCVIPLPDALSGLLAQHAAIGVLNAIGDVEAVDRVSRVAEQMTARVLPLISERIEGEPQVVRPTFQNRGRSWRW
jgi:hypothetical protein